MIKPAIHKILKGFGLKIVRYDPGYPPDFQEEDTDIIRQSQPWTMTSAERIYALIQAVRYVSSNEIAGSIVECGVWKGGSMAAAATTLMRLNDASRDLYLFDTFTGMSEPTAKDLDYTGKQAAELLVEIPGVKCDEAPLESVRQLLLGTGYPANKVHFVQGKVEETIPASAPELISILRLDTDWYESTKHELIHLFPRLSRNGVIIIDDYGHWKGSRQACDEYFTEQGISILLNRIDYTGRIGLKS
jgi:O-methyltransferase